MSVVSRQFVLGLSLALAGCSFARSLKAKEPVAAFLHAAQDAGYGEVSVEYLESLRARGKLPKEIAETFDLELSRSYRIAVAESFNAAEAEDRAAKAQAHLNKFLKEYPNHAEVPKAMESWGDIALDRALQRIRQARGTKDDAQREKIFATARADLEEARPRFADALARYLETYTQEKAALAELTKKPKSLPSAAKKLRLAEDQVRAAEVAWLDARFKAAKIDFYLGQTFADPKSPERNAALEAAAKGFDAIFQSYRESLVGLHAHMWHGRVADEMGNDQLAMDIYDEVLATSPEGRERETGLEPLFAQVEYHRLRVVARKLGSKAVLDEANPWLQQHRTWKKLDGYQGVALEAAKAHLKDAAELKADKKTAQTQAALAQLNEVGKTPGEHQMEAVQLRREFTKSAPTDPNSATTFNEAVALSELAAQSEDWPAAAAGFARAIALSGAVKDARRVAAVQSRLDQARYHVAAGQLAEGNAAESLAAAETLLRDRPDGPLAANASSLAISAALSLYAGAKDKQAALEKLTGLTTATIERWPDKAEADDARIALGQASLVRGDLPAAIDVFEKVNPRSQRYATALFLAGQTHWRRYLLAKTKTDASAERKPLNAERSKAEEQLQASLAAQRKDAPAGQPLAKQRFETQLLFAELKLDAGHADQASELVQPLLTAVRAEKPEALDNTSLRVFLTAARAQATAGALPKVAGIAQSLAGLSPDTPAANGVLYSMLKMVGDGWKAAEAASIEARSATDPQVRGRAEATAAQRKDLLSQLVTRLAPRKQFTLPATIYLAETAGQLGLVDIARERFEAILAQAVQDPAFEQANSTALTRIRAQAVGLMRQKGQYREGLAEVEKLIAKHPNALEPLMEKGRLLQSWSDTDPGRAAEAVAHWTMLRTRLSRIAKKPPEYYEIVFNAASCLFSDSLKTKNPAKALQAEQLLNATLVLSPNLNGPEMVAKYKELLQKVRQLQGRPLNAAR